MQFGNYVLTFHTPLLLWFLFSILIPIAIHFISRFNRKKIIFPSVFLFESQLIEIHRSFQFRDFFLLLLRIILVMLLVLLLANPQCTQNVNPSEPEQDKKTYYFLLDNSFSMNYAEHTTLFEEAQDLIRTIIKRLPNTIQTAVSVTQPLGAMNVQLHQSKDSCLKQLGLLSINPHQDFKPEQLQQFLDICNAHESPNPTLIVVSNFQKNNWEFVQLEVPFPVLYLHLGEQRSNQAIHSVNTDQLVGWVGKPFSINTQLDNYAPQEKSIAFHIWDRNVDSKETERLLYTKQLTLPSLMDTNHQSLFQFATPGIHQLRIQVEQDKYPYDNEQYIRVPIYQRISVLIVTPTSDQLMEPILVNALASKEDRRRRWFDVDTSPSQSNYDVMVAYNLTTCSEHEQNLLQHHLTQKKSTIILMGAEDTPQQLHSLFRSWGFFTTVEFSRFIQGKFSLNIDRQLDATHPFRQKMGSNLSGIQFDRYLQMEYDTLEYIPLLRFSSGDTFLVTDATYPFYFMNADVIFSNSTITAKQGFPLLLNHLARSSLKKYHQSKLSNQPDNPSAIQLEQGETIDLTTAQLESQIFLNPSVEQISASSIRSDIPGYPLQYHFDKPKEEGKSAHKSTTTSLSLYLIMLIFFLLFVEHLISTLLVKTENH